MAGRIVVIPNSGDCSKSRRVVPTRLLREGFQFQFPEITIDLVNLLERKGREDHTKDRKHAIPVRSLR